MTNEIVLDTPQGNFIIESKLAENIRDSSFYISGFNCTNNAQRNTFKIAVCKSDKIQNEKLKNKLLAEKKIFDSLNSRLFPKCIEFGQGMLDFNGNLSLVFYLKFSEEIPKISLLNYFENKEAFGCIKIQNIFAQICEAIDILHDNGICYNVFTLGKIAVNTVKNQICLFNLSEATLLEKQKKGKLQDVYMLGIFLFLLQTGRYPFENTEDCKWRKLFYSPMRYYYWQTIAERTKGITVQFINIVNAMLEENENRRISVKKLRSHSFITSEAAR